MMEPWIALLALVTLPGPAAAQETTDATLRELLKAVEEQRTEIRQLRERISELEGRPVPAAFAPGVREAATAAPVAAATRDEEPRNRLGFVGGAYSGQFRSGWGPMVIANIDLSAWDPDPIFGENISGLISIGYGWSEDELSTVTPLLLPAQTNVDFKTTSFFVMPGLKLTVESWDETVRPYFFFGPAVYVQGAELRNGLLGGQVPLPVELQRRSAPDSWFEPEVGGQFGAGFYLDVSDSFFFNVEGRYHVVTDKDNDFGSVGAGLGVRW